MKRIRMKTLNGRAEFEYLGTLEAGTDIYFGEDFNSHQFVSSDDYRKLLINFRGKKAKTGFAHANKLPEGSLGEWLKINVSSVNLGSYVASILKKEELLEYPQKGWLHFK